jgi:hypothetical protein
LFFECPFLPEQPDALKEQRTTLWILEFAFWIFLYPFAFPNTSLHGPNAPLFLIFVDPEIKNE